MNNHDTIKFTVEHDGKSVSYTLPWDAEISELTSVLTSELQWLTWSPKLIINALRDEADNLEEDYYSLTPEDDEEED